mgnify:CR=1 FL=1
MGAEYGTEKWMGKSVGVGVSAAGRVDYYSVERTACIPAAKASVRASEICILASIDELTGLYNRRYLGELLDKLCKGENAFAVFYMDLNHFKAVNDELGHAAGDAILKEASERMRSCAGGDNPTARIGGDEFVVVCPGSRLAEIKNMESRLREVIEKPFYVDGECRQLSLSIGIAVFPEDGKTYDSLMQKADHRMY